MKNHITTLLFLVCSLVTVQAQELNIYSARHYDSDQELYQLFEKQTGIKINLIEAKGDALLARILSEGKNSPADVFITVDAGNLWKAQSKGIFQATPSPILQERIPSYLRHPQNYWFGIAKRARVIYYNKETVSPQELSTYEDLAHPRWKNRIVVRSSGNIYNQSLLASIIAASGKDAAIDWAEKVSQNMVRKPQGNDRSQMQAVANGEADIAIANSYYFGRYFGSTNPQDQELVRKLGVFFPNQCDRGTHINISGAGVLKNAPHPKTAQRFIEFLTTPEAQSIFASRNFEFSVVRGSKEHPYFSFLSFKEDQINVAQLGELNAEAVKAFDIAGWR